MILGQHTVTWQPTKQFHVDTECEHYVEALHLTLETAIIENNLNVKNDYVIATYCVQTNPKQIEH